MSRRTFFIITAMVGIALIAYGFSFPSEVGQGASTSTLIVMLGVIISFPFLIFAIFEGVEIY